MADSRAKAVTSELADLTSRANYMLDIIAGVRDLREPLGRGDIVDVASVATSITVNADGSSSSAPQALTVGATSVNCNLEPFVNVLIPARDDLQVANGGWARGVAREGMDALRNSVDSSLAAFLLQSIVADLSATYVDNPAADSLTSADILNCKAALLDQDGASDLKMFVGPFGQSSIANISGFIPNYQAAEAGRVGLEMLGSVHGLPVYQTNSIPRRRTVASTAFSDDGSTLTLTVASGHGVEAGMPVSYDLTAGTSHDIAAASPATVSSVTATTVVVPTVSAGSGGAGVITIQATENILVDCRNGVYVARQQMPVAALVKDINTSGSALQLSMIWGRAGRAGRARSLLSPPASA